MSLHKFEKEARRLFQERRQNLNLQEMLVNALNYQRTQCKMNVRLMKRPQDKESLIELEIVNFVLQEREDERREWLQRSDRYMIGVVVALTEEQHSFQRIQYRGLPCVNFVLTDHNVSETSEVDAVDAVDEQTTSKTTMRDVSRPAHMEFDRYTWIKIVEAILFIQNLHVPEGIKFPVYYGDEYDYYGFLRPVELVESLKPSIVVEGKLMNAIVRPMDGWSYQYANRADLTAPEEMAKNLYLYPEVQCSPKFDARVEYTEDFITAFNLSTQK